MWRKNHWPPSLKSSVRAWPPERASLAQRGRIIPTTGWVVWQVPDLHAIAILFARDVAERERCRQEHDRYLSQCEGVEVLSSLDLEAIPPFDYCSRTLRLP